MADVTAQLSAFKAVIGAGDPPLLGPQRRPGAVDEAELDGKLVGYFAAHPISTRAKPLLKSAALLWHDHLAASHTISRGIESRDWSWLHGIMHRREPDTAMPNIGSGASA